MRIAGCTPLKRDSRFCIVVTMFFSDSHLYPACCRSRHRPVRLHPQPTNHFSTTRGCVAGPGGHYQQHHQSLQRHQRNRYSPAGTTNQRSAFSPHKRESFYMFEKFRGLPVYVSSKAMVNRQWICAHAADPNPEPR